MMQITEDGIDNKFDTGEYKGSVSVNITCKGNNNYIKIPEKLIGNGNIEIKIKGNNNTIILKENIRINRKLNIFLLSVSNGTCNNVKVLIEDDVFINGNCDLICAEQNNSISIGKKCLIAGGVKFMTSDFHSICSIDSKKRLNKSSDIIIKENVWIAEHVLFLKGAIIPKNCVVGIRSLITKVFTEENTVIAGNPAKVIKRNIEWKLDCI